MSDKSHKFINRELSWLEFNERVLQEALDESVPALDRLKFLAITASNLDEFFMVRAGGLELLRAEGITTRDPAGLTPAEQLAAIARRARRMVGDQYACFLESIEPAMLRHGIRRIAADALTPAQTEFLREYFASEVMPVVTPMRAGADEFPALANLALHLAVRLAPEKGSRAGRYAVIPIGRNMARMVPLPTESGYAYVLIEDVIRMFISDFFRGVRVAETAAFRIARNADLTVHDEDDAADFMAEMEEILLERKRSGCVRLEVEDAAGRGMRAFLQGALGIDSHGVFAVGGPLGLADFMALTSLDGFDSLRYEPWPPQPNPAIDSRSTIFEQLERRNVLLVHPYDAFDPVLRFLQEAALDPNVLAIKQVLYRTSADSPVILALREAAQRGKQVTVLVELKARFDEARNIDRARSLEQAGAQVIYGLRGLKTHAKVCIVVRREPGGVARYVHFGTGNYNERTARLYSDVSYFTRDDDLGQDASAFFNAVSGYSEPQKFRKLEMSPLGLLEKLIELIDGETERQRQGQQAFITAKMNSLADPDVIKALYRASKAGVPVRLNVRGICCLRAGVPGLSESITVTSIVDRFLEHSRIFCFCHGGEGKVFISSADWMPRNLRRRVELLVPVTDDPSRKRLVALLDTYFKDTRKSWRMLPDGTYERVSLTAKRKTVRSQEILYREAVASFKQARQAERRTFEPYTSPQGNH